MNETIILAALIFFMALLYSSVGHGGASGYLAAFGLMNVAVSVMKPSALVLNVLVSLIASVRFYQAGWFAWRVFAPFAVASIPFAYLGGGINLDSRVHKQIVGAILVYAAFRLWGLTREMRRAEVSNGNPTQSFEDTPDEKPISEIITSETSSTVKTSIKPVPLIFALAWGAGLGFLSGLVGVGGGIFLSPLLLLAGWATVQGASAIAAAFILANSLAGLAGAWSNVTVLPTSIYLWSVAAIVGGAIGAELGSRRFASVTLRRILAVVLIIAAGKMIFVK